MGSSASGYYDDCEDYRFLCEKHNEKYVEVYSNHYYWLQQKDKNKTTLTYQEYDKEMKKKSLQNKIFYKERELENLKQELDGL